MKMCGSLSQCKMKSPNTDAPVFPFQEGASQSSYPSPGYCGQGEGIPGNSLVQVGDQIFTFNDVTRSFKFVLVL